MKLNRENINVLGTPYKIIFIDDMDKEYDGSCDFTSKTIKIKNFVKTDDCLDDLKIYTEQVIRHELIHAFLDESGLRDECQWAVEEMIDFFAIQWKKINRTLNSVMTLWTLNTKDITTIILGTKYKVHFWNEKEFADIFQDEIAENIDGASNWLSKTIAIKVEDSNDIMQEYKDIDIKRKLAHQLIHVFLNESGLQEECAWANNEEMVTYFANQFSKITKAFKEIIIIDDKDV